MASQIVNEVVAANNAYAANFGKKSELALPPPSPPASCSETSPSQLHNASTTTGTPTRFHICMKSLPGSRFEHSGSQ